MRRRGERRLSLLVSGLALAALLLGVGGMGLVRAQDATPGAGDDQATIVAAPSVNDQADETPTIETAEATAPPADNETLAPSPSPSPDDAPSPSPSPSDAPAPSPSPSPSLAPSPSPSPEWINHDSLTLTGSDPAAGTPLPPGGLATATFTYAVTTPRTGTTIHAELRNAGDDPAPGWQVRLTSLDGAGDDWSAAGNTAEQTDTATTDPGTTFTLTIAIRAPAEVTAPETVSLFVRSSATTPNGTTEAGVAADAPVAQAAVAPPAPSASPTPSPSASPPPLLAPATPPAAATPATAPANTATCAADGATLPVAETGAATFGTTTWNGTSYPALTETVDVTLSLPAPDACLASTWSVSIAASAMETDGGTIPANDITYQGVQDLIAPGLNATGLVPGTPLDTAQAIVTGTHQTLDANHPTATFQVTLAVSPPNNAPIGTYRGQITVTLSTSP